MIQRLFGRRSLLMVQTTGIGESIPGTPHFFSTRTKIFCQISLHRLPRSISVNPFTTDQNPFLSTNRNPNPRIPKRLYWLPATRLQACLIRNSGFGVRISFGLRFSGFGFGANSPYSADPITFINLVLPPAPAPGIIPNNKSRTNCR